MVRSGLALMIATGCYSGLAPVAPGTAGSAAAAVIGAGCSRYRPRCWRRRRWAATVAGFWAVPLVAGADEDPGEVVIDEWAGQWLAMAALGRVSLLGVLAAFGLFRLFDITKPGPIGWADRQGGAFGIITDDLLAGAAAAAVLLLVRHFGWLP